MGSEFLPALARHTHEDQKKSWIFGQGISFSMSPTIHLAGFAYHNLPYNYKIHQTKTVEELKDIITSPAFGGASVTMPHKVAIRIYCSEISKDAETIGAVNTLIRDKSKNDRIVGANTDWMGLASLLRERNQTSSEKLNTGLVIGAGGASRAALYAMYKLGFHKIYLFNRTISKAEDIAQSLKTHFEIVVLDQLTDIRVNEAPKVIIGTIPADRTDIELFPPVLFSQPEGICIDMSYKPRLTPLMMATRLFASQAWSTVPGVEVLLRQGFVQFELWTGKSAPEMEMRRALDAKDVKDAGEAEIGQKL